MGQARRRREQLGSLYGTAEGSNKPRPHESVCIYKSAWTGKWAVGLDIPGGELRCLDVFLNYEAAEQDAMAAREAFKPYTWSDIKNEESWPSILQEYIQLSASYGVVSDDECLAVASITGIAPAQINAQLREMDALSDNVWHRNVSTQ